MKIVKSVNYEQLMEKVEAYEIFALYMPWEFKLNRKCKNPFTDKDNNPSFIIGNKFGEVTFKGFNSDNRGGAIDFVMQYFNLSYHEAIQKCAEDFGLLDKSGNKYVEVIQKLPKPKIIVKNPVKIIAEGKEWTKSHVEYLNRFHLAPEDLNFCSDTKVVALDRYWLNGSKMPFKKSEIGFIYNLKNERGDWIKIYRPNAQKRDKFLSSIPFTEMHGLSNLKGCKTGIIGKSVKDGAFIAKYINPCVSLLQAEDYSALSKTNTEYIGKSCEKVFVTLDSDSKGVLACKSITSETGWNYINPPKKLLPEVTDWCEMAEKYGKDAVIEFFKLKGVI